MSAPRRPLTPLILLTAFTHSHGCQVSTLTEEASGPEVHSRIKVRSFWHRLPERDLLTEKWSFQDVVLLELSAAGVNKARATTLVLERDYCRNHETAFLIERPVSSSTIICIVVFFYILFYICTVCG